MRFKEDITARIHADFGEDFNNAFEILRSAIEKTDDLNSDRIIRCIIFLAKGNIDALHKYIKVATVDPRDIMLWAEYEASNSSADHKRLRDFDKTFEEN
ncbi:hypothetical protein [Cytophaga aurantiaca]|uniref:hypothetical protein n=1 Tax=Cytophaga aurantiaca TaxID=29530 RepID=UPI0003652339|nr:hypothetical protein [Cytophaga aurantiaca]